MRLAKAKIYAIEMVKGSALAKCLVILSARRITYRSSGNLSRHHPIQTPKLYSVR